MPDVKRMMQDFRHKADREGFSSAWEASTKAIGDRVRGKYLGKRNPEGVEFVDVMFVNGCGYWVPHPIRYRVDHQIQQLEAAGLSTMRVEAWDVTPEMAGSARAFVIFRATWTEQLGEFVAEAKRLNKKVYYDIDDLVIDRKYTDQIEYVQQMSPEDKADYDSFVDGMGRALLECGSVITTTEGMAQELANYVPEVFINRNVASEEMIHFSERALRERDVLPYLEESQVQPGQKHYWQWARERAEARKGQGVRIGYFSGSITHNPDLELVLPALMQLMDERVDVRLRVVGEIDIPAQLEPYADRVEFAPFCEWGELPRLIAECDINIAPLEDTVFNRAKSENKWVEAALVKVPTVASNVGAFKQMIKQTETGLLCSTTQEWHDVLLKLVDNPGERRRIGQAAYDWVHKHAISIATSTNLANYLKANFTPSKVFFYPSLNTSGGLVVAGKHAQVLHDAGYDVMIVNGDPADTRKWLECEGVRLPVRRIKSPDNKDNFPLSRGSIDHAICTWWGTVWQALDYKWQIKRISYLVQNYESYFFLPGERVRLGATSTYTRDDIEYLTISRWCENWLKEDFDKDAAYLPNGIDCAAFPQTERDWSGKIRILVEGDCAVDYKNVDEAFRVIDRLDPEKYEVWYMSYNAEPKATYRVDRFLHHVPHEKVGQVYGQCHILLKTSWLESFSYPPLEMMATGGMCVVVPNDGNVEFIENEKNCLTYELGDIDAAVACIERLVEDSKLRDKLSKNGISCAQERDWDKLTERIVEFYT